MGLHIIDLMQNLKDSDHASEDDDITSTEPNTEVHITECMTEVH